MHCNRGVLGILSTMEKLDDFPAYKLQHRSHVSIKDWLSLILRNICLAYIARWNSLKNALMLIAPQYKPEYNKGREFNISSACLASFAAAAPIAAALS